MIAESKFRQDDEPNFSTPQKAALFTSKADNINAGFTANGGAYAGGGNNEMLGTHGNLGKVSGATSQSLL